MAEVISYPRPLTLEDIKSDKPLWKVINPKQGDIVRTLRPFRIYKENTDGTVEICDDNGNCLRAVVKELYFSIDKTELIMKAMKDAVLTVAKDLAKANNTVTTLDIKIQLRRDYPYYFWDQSTVSKYMDGLAGDGLFTYKDNGTYRIYSLVNPPASAPASVPAKTVTKTVVAGKGTANTVSVTSPAVVKVLKNKINTYKLLALANDPNFSAFVLRDGTTVSKSTIKGQKKSPLGYANPKLGKIKSVVVGTTQYNVK